MCERWRGCRSGTGGLRSAGTRAAHRGPPPPRAPQVAPGAGSAGAAHPQHQYLRRDSSSKPGGRAAPRHAAARRLSLRAAQQLRRLTPPGSGDGSEGARGSGRSLPARLTLQSARRGRPAPGHAASWRREVTSRPRRPLRGGRWELHRPPARPPPAGKWGRPGAAACPSRRGLQAAPRSLFSAATAAPQSPGG